MDENKKETEDINPNEKIARELEEWQKEYYDLVDEPFRRQNQAEGEVAFDAWENRFKRFLYQKVPSLGSEYQLSARRFVKNIFFSRNPSIPHQTWKKDKGNIIEAFLKNAIINARAGRLEIVNNASIEKRQVHDKGVDMDDIQEIKKRRFQFLLKLYQKTNANTWNAVNTIELGNEMGYAQEETSKIEDYLKAQRLIEGSGFGQIAITHQGVVEIETALTKPKEPTQHFPATYNITIGEMHGSQIQQGTSHSTQVLDYTSNDLQSILSFVSNLKSKISELDLSETTKAEIETDIATIEAQIKSPRPKAMIIKESLQSLRTILEGAAGSMVATVLLPQMTQWLS